MRRNDKVDGTEARNRGRRPECRRAGDIGMNGREKTGKMAVSAMALPFMALPFMALLAAAVILCLWNLPGAEAAELPEGAPEGMGEPVEGSAESGVVGSEGVSGDGQTTVIYMPEDYDLGYEGVLDQRTGGVPDDAVPDDADVVMITDTCGYDTQQRMYVNYVQGNREKRYYSSLPNGIITNGSISFQMGTRSGYVLYRNGDRVTDADIYNIVQEGSYVMETYGQGSTDGDRFEFTIVQSVTNSMEWFTIPEGFRFMGITVNGEQAAAPAGTSSQMASDGEYVYEFGCDKTGISYYVSLEKDTVAPRLELEGVLSDIARGPVTLVRTDDEDSIIEILRDGQTVNVPYSLVLEDYGTYTVTVRDAAGNSNEYRFTIQMYFTMTSMLVFVLLFMVAVGLAGYFRYVKTHLRVR